VVVVVGPTRRGDGDGRTERGSKASTPPLSSVTSSALVTLIARMVTRMVRWRVAVARQSVCLSVGGDVT
jgi:hypothetical protein